MKKIGVLIFVFLMFSIGVSAEEIVLCGEDFEGDFPNDNVRCSWELNWCGFAFTWDDDDCRAASGIKSAHGANGRRADDEGIDPCESTYPNNMCASMVAGPYDLSDVESAYVEYDYWVRTQMEYDRLAVFSSLDSFVDVDSNVHTGDLGDEWHSAVLNLEGVLGESRVFLVFGFFTDSYTSTGYIPNGVFVDNIRLIKIGEKSDLVVDDLIVRPREPTCDDLVQVRGVIKNEGGSSQASTVGFYLDGVGVCNLEISSIPSNGELLTDWCDLGTSLCDGGEHTIKGVVDTNDENDETDEGNNDICEGVLSCGCENPQSSGFCTVSSGSPVVLKGGDNDLPFNINKPRRSGEFNFWNWIVELFN